MASILIIYRPGVDLSPAHEAAEGVELAFLAATDGPEALEGLDRAETHDAVIVTPPVDTREGDAYQAAARALTNAGFPVVEMTPEFETPFDPDDNDHPGAIGAMATVAGFGAAGYAIAIDLLRQRIET